MQQSKIEAICRAFHIDGTLLDSKECSKGLINKTCRVYFDTGAFVLQQINTNVFKNPDALMKNYSGITEFLKARIIQRGGNPERETINLLAVSENNYLFRDDEGGCWRMYKYIDNVTAYDSAQKEGVLFEAARTFGEFQRSLADYPTQELYESIPDFHNTANRYKVFLRSVSDDLSGRADNVKDEIAILSSFSARASIITDALKNGDIPTRVTHNDTKLNNVLIDNATGKGICVIDLDTIMPGSLLYDFGDSVRFAANTAAEDDPELSHVSLDLGLFYEYTDGFLTGIENSITPREKELLPISVFILTYELALRFMSDYIDGDKYFGIKYPEHNLVRARNQIRLMLDTDSKLGEMSKIVKELSK